MWIGYHDATYWSISGNEFSLRMRKQRRPKTFSAVERFFIEYHRMINKLGKEQKTREGGSLGIKFFKIAQ